MNAQPRPCILLVECDIVVRSPLAEYLRECGYRVLEAVNTIEARELLGKADDITLVLADADAPVAGAATGVTGGEAASTGTTRPMQMHAVTEATRVARFIFPVPCRR